MGIGKGRPGVARGHAIRTHQEVADILFAAGVLARPCRDQVRYSEKQAMRKIRRDFPELANLLVGSVEPTRQSPVVRIY